MGEGGEGRELPDPGSRWWSINTLIFGKSESSSPPTFFRRIFGDLFILGTWKMSPLTGIYIYMGGA